MRIPSKYWDGWTFFGPYVTYLILLIIKEKCGSIFLTRRRCSCIKVGILAILFQTLEMSLLLLMLTLGQDNWWNELSLTIHKRFFYKKEKYKKLDSWPSLLLHLYKKFLFSGNFFLGSIKKEQKRDIRAQEDKIRRQVHYVQ